MNQTLDTGVRGEDGVLWRRRSDPGPDGLGDGVDRVMCQWDLYSHPAIRLGSIGRTWGTEGGDDQTDEAAWGNEGLWLNRVGEHVHWYQILDVSIYHSNVINRYIERESPCISTSLHPPSISSCIGHSINLSTPVKLGVYSISFSE